MKNSIWNWKLRSNVFVHIQKLMSALPKKKRKRKAIVEHHNLYQLLKKFVALRQLFPNSPKTH